MIKRVTGLPEKELLSRLSILKDSELLFERGIYPDTIYIFKHALTREVVYNSILNRRREELHEYIGNAIEKICQESIDEYYGVLAEHYILSKNYEKGADYSKLAERKAEKAASLNEAISYAKKKISCLEKLPVDEDVEKKIISAKTTLGLYYSQIVFPTEAKAIVDPIVDLAIKYNLKRRISQIYVILGFYYQSCDENYPEAKKYLQKAINIGEQLNDLITLVLANNIMGYCQTHSGEFAKALPYFEKALNINIMANTQWGIVALKAQMTLGVYCPLGNVPLAYQNSKEALRIAAESGDVFSKAHANHALASAYFSKGCLNKAEEHFLKAIDLQKKSKQLAYAAFATTYLSAVHIDMEEYEKSKINSEKAIYYCRHFSFFPSVILLNKILISLAKVMTKEKDIHPYEVFKWHEGFKNKWFKRLGLSYIAKILLNIDGQYLSEAEDWIKRSIETNHKYAMIWNLARDYALYADFFKRKGDLSKAREKLTKAIEIFNECGADGWVEKYQNELAKL